MQPPSIIEVYPGPVPASGVSSEKRVNDREEIQAWRIKVDPSFQEPRVDEFDVSRKELESLKIFMEGDEI